MMDEKDFWRAVESIAKCQIIVDRPAGTTHPRHPDIVYPHDYGYLKDTRADDGCGIDVWRSHRSRKDVTGIICTVDLTKRDMEMKILIGLNREESEELVAFHTRGMQKALLFFNPVSPQD